MKKTPCVKENTWKAALISVNNYSFRKELSTWFVDFTIPFNDLNGPLAVKNDIIKSGLVYKKNKLELSKKPGLGIELNEKIVDEYKYKSDE